MSLRKIVTLTAVLLLGALPAHAEDYVVLFSLADMTTYTPAENDSLGSYYLVQFQLPAAAQGRELDAAILEFYVDADAFARHEELYANNGPEGPDAFVNATPTIEVFAPTGTFTGTLGGNALAADSRATAPIALGEDRRAVVDVTDIIQPILDENATNHGLVIGSITGMRDGKFSLLAGNLGNGIVARLGLYLLPAE